MKTVPRGVLNIIRGAQQVLELKQKQFSIFSDMNYFSREGTAKSTLGPGLQSRTFFFGIWTQLTT